MTNSEKATSALRSIFPDISSLNSFKQDCNDDILQSLVLFAFKAKLISQPDYSEFKEFIQQKHLSKAEPDTNNVPKTFEELLDRKNELLEIDFSISRLTEEINKLLKDSHLKLNRIKNRSVFTNLKKQHSPDTYVKRNALRAFAFWIGYYRSHLVLKYNYEKLLQLCKNKKIDWNEKEGCRVAFALYDRGDDIDLDMLDWLSREIKNYLKENFEKSSFKFTTENITTRYVDIFIDQHHESFNNPSSYSKSINFSISLAYQISIKWALSPFGAKQTFLSIGLAAGKFKLLDIYIKSILKEKLPDDPAIRMTDFTRQCILMNEIRVIINNVPKEIEISSGEMIHVWWITGLWNTIYWDFIPEMISDSVLQSDNKLINLLWLNEEVESQQKNNMDAISLMLRFPSNTLLGLEIAKTLYYRQKFFEANEVLRIILSREPSNIIARSLRMSIFWNIGLICDNYPMSNTFFKSAEEESTLIENYSNVTDEDYYCDRGLGIMANAMTLFRMLRNKQEYHQNNYELSKQEVLNLIIKAESIYEKGFAVSPTGATSIYFIACTRSFRRIITLNDTYFQNSDCMILDKNEIFIQTGKELFSLMGWLRFDLPENQRYSLFFKILEKLINVHSNATFLKGFKPNALFCYAVLLWDFFPYKTVDSAKRVLNLLYEAKQLAKKLEKDNLCIYNTTTLYGQIVKAATFIEHMERIIYEIESRTNKIQVLSEMDKNEVIDHQDIKHLKICLLNI